jgi:hypothetical protein
MKHSNNTIGNQTRDLLACSAVHKPTAPPSACPLCLVHTFRFSTGRRFRLSPEKVEHRTEHACSHNPVVGPAGKKPECVNVSISNTCTTVDLATGRRPGLVVDSSGCYPAAGRQIPGWLNSRVVSIRLCFPVFN